MDNDSKKVFAEKYADECNVSQERREAFVADIIERMTLNEQFQQELHLLCARYIVVVPMPILASSLLEQGARMIAHHAAVFSKEESDAVAVFKELADNAAEQIPEMTRQSIAAIDKTIVNKGKGE